MQISRMSHPVADYLHELYLISGVSVPETSGYPALSKLLSAVGGDLRRKISLSDRLQTC